MIIRPVVMASDVCVMVKCDRFNNTAFASLVNIGDLSKMKVELVTPYTPSSGGCVAHR